MKTVKSFPPNSDLIQAALTPPPDALYCYGDTIYNPSGKEIPADIHYHEYIHSLQQGDNPDAWWSQYLLDEDFRLDQEIEAYGMQYLFVCKYIDTPAIRKWALDSMSTALSSESYGRLLTYGQASSKIRNYSPRNPLWLK